MNVLVIKKNYEKDSKFFRKLFTKKISSFIYDDKLCVSIQYRIIFNKKLNLKDPKTFNEKLQWLKLYDRRPEYTIFVDKYAVREYITQKIGDNYLIPLLKVWNSPDEIDFKQLPNQFVLKCNHDSGGLYICKDKTKSNFKEILNKLKESMNTDYYKRYREWPYKNVIRKIIAEKYMIDESTGISHGLQDYKFMCFNGCVKCSLVCSDRFGESGLHITWFDRDWNVLPIERQKYPSIKSGLPKPKCYEEMVCLAEKLSKDIPFVRVDFYEINGKVYFGELTFFPGSGLEEFIPQSADEWLGSLLQLPIKTS